MKQREHHTYRATKRSDPEARKQLFAIQMQAISDIPHRYDRKTERGLTRTLRRHLSGRFDGVRTPTW